MPSPELSRAARVLMVRSRREAVGLFAGDYASAFRGGGLDFEESRPYVPGDDVRRLDWNATARRGEPFVKRFREERDQTLLFALDVSGSMGFGTAGGSKAAVAAHAVALLAAAAARVGDRTGLVVFDAAVRTELPVGRGAAHGWRLIRTALQAAESSRGATRLSAGLAALRRHARRRSVVFLLSDFRDPELPALRRELSGLARRHDLVAARVADPREGSLPDVGPVRIVDPEGAGSALLHTGRGRVRERYVDAAAAHRRAVLRELRGAGADLLALPTDARPFSVLARFFRERAARRPRAAA